jgi:glutamine synthetase
VNSIINDTAYSEVGKRTLEIGVDSMPTIPQDNTDRNRTSPMAFTGNKFEFRMLGSSLSVSGPNIVLNTMMAEELRQFADELSGSRNFNKDVAALIKRELTAHQRIIFDGNGYDESWLAEAKRRGLCNLPTAVDALPAYVTEKNIALFAGHNIYTREEVYARYNIHVENYTATIAIEARTMIDMLRKEILPATSKYGSKLCDGLAKRKALGLPAKYEENNARNNCMLSNCLSDACDKLEKDLLDIPQQPEDAMHYCHNVIIPDMNECRSFADELETITDKEAWPIPTYSDLLFSEI